MSNVVGRIVRSFRSLDYGQWNTGNHSSSIRRSLDTPRLLLNMMHTDDGHLWMPPAPSEFITGVSGTGDLYLIRQTFEPSGIILVQKGDTVSLYDISAGSIPYTSADSTTVLTDDEKVWVLAFGGALYFGNSTQTLKATSAASVTDITGAGIPDGYHSMSYRNRRYVVERVFGTSGGVNERLHYSDIGDPETFGANSFIDIEAYFEGDSWENALGSPIAAEAYGDVLGLFTSQGVVRFTGTDPETNFTLRPTLSAVGAWMRDSIAKVSQGVIFFGGTPRGEFGFYLWQGNTSQLISEQLNGYLRQWVESGQTFNEDLSDATVWRNRYISSLDVGADPTIYVYDWQRQNWATFNGWTRPTIGLARKGTDRLCVADSDGTTVYSTTSPMFRASDTTAARFRVGYEDEDQPSGLVRFQTLRLTVNAKASGGTGISVTCIADVVGTGTVIPPVQTITGDGQVTLDFPLRARGSAIDIEMVFSPSAASHEVLVENLELVQSRKSLKVVRTNTATVGGVNGVEAGAATLATTEDGGDGTTSWDVDMVMPSCTEGDFLVAVMSLANWGIGTGATLSVPSGWTAFLTPEGDDDFAAFVAYKTASAADEAGTSTYTMTATSSDPQGGLDQTRGQVTAVSTDATAVVGLADIQSVTFTDVSTTTYTSSELTSGDWGLVIAHARNTSQGGSRNGVVDTLTSPVTELAAGNAGEADTGVGTIPFGSAASADLSGTTAGGTPMWDLLVVIPMYGGT